eukprot:3581143-Amphidinium_carterae.1
MQLEVQQHDRHVCATTVQQTRDCVLGDRVGHEATSAKACREDSLQCSTPRSLSCYRTCQSVDPKPHMPWS